MRASIRIVDPADGSLAHEVPCAKPDDVRQSVARVRDAQPGWARVAPVEHGALLRSEADAVEAAADRLAVLRTTETGKPLGAARGGVAAGVATRRLGAALVTGKPAAVPGASR